ncbi:HPP family protein [Pleurocapsa sp. PCC 7319]|uniref:HPP family protein n=1 Tax=Pleurocapsa sp. PCC 7319 TaxID=118161 RepID=UPI0003489CDA|nr:HPP family protein [Pleurocapsa sp. PCC 7319]
MNNTQIENSAEQGPSVPDATDLIESHQVEQKLELYEDIFKHQQEQIDLLTRELERLKNSPSKTKFSQKSWKSLWRRLTQYFASIHGSSTYQPRFSLAQIVFSYLGSFIGIGALAYLSIVSDYPLIAAPFGAAAVLVFAVPNSPLAQPRNLIFGNLIGGIVSILMVYLFGSEAWVMALSVATAIKVMQLTKTLHPPGGAVALVGVMSEADLSFLLTPVLAGSIILLFCTLGFNNLMPERSYPRHWL